MNRQLLLNLARLSNNEPAYFIQLGTITSQYQFTTSDTFTPNHVATTRPNGTAAGIVQTVRTLGGTVGGGMTSTPSFQFVPLNGTVFAQTLINEIPIGLLYAYYKQGFHADTLIRTIVTSVQLKDAAGKVTILVNEPLDPSYRDFLIFCKELRIAQLKNTVVVGDVSSGAVAPKLTVKSVTVNEVLAAKTAGYTVSDGCGSNYSMTPTNAMKQGFKLRDKLPAGSPAPTDYIKNTFSGADSVTFQMRTFEAAMYSVAKEGVYFELLSDGAVEPPYNGVTFKHGDGTDNGVVATVTYGGRSFSAYPILTLTERPNLSTLVEVNHDGRDYFVGDPKEQPVADPETSLSTSNRTVFTLLSYLFTQVSIDPGKLPAQQLIQVSAP